MRWKTNTFEELVEQVKLQATGSKYEQEHGLTPRCATGFLQRPDLGIITTITEDGQVSLYLAYFGGKYWNLWFPSDEQFDYLFNDFPKHLRAIYNNNLPQEKVKRVLGEKMESNNEIDWSKFQSKYLKVEIGKQHRVCLTNWRQETKKFGETDEARVALVFDVVAVDDVNYSDAPLEWATTGASLIFELKPVIERAMSKGKDKIYILLKRKSQQEFQFFEQGD